MTINGAILVGDEDRQAETRFHAVYPADGAESADSFSQASASDVSDACALAQQAYPAFSALEPNARAAFLEAVAAAILEIGDVLIETAMAETGLPRARLEGERMRTVNQLRLFAGEVRAGYWLDVTIDPALPDRSPPRADLRRMNIALGPVAVFGASNFPLAFSVAGGDTASALAAGCPVVVKGHAAHPGTGELVARAVRSAVQAAALPQGVFSYLPGSTHELGTALVRDPRIQAVGFTGSRSGGLALTRIAAEREKPIPVYAEMSSVNPIVLMPGALNARAESLGEAFVASLVMGAGQFCTNPGLVLGIDSPALDRFVEAAGKAVAAATPAVMLTPGIHFAYGKGVAALAARDAVRQVASGKDDAGANLCRAMLFEASAEAFLADPALGEEVFGSSSLIVRCRDMAELKRVLAALEGQLTATMHADEADMGEASELMGLLTGLAGRVLANGWPTGVEVTHAMVHGGPYPATSNAQTTSVGTLAMHRFLRPVCYQDIAEGLLPKAVQENNPWGVPRRVDGTRI